MLAGKLANVHLQKSNEKWRTFLRGLSLPHQTMPKKFESFRSILSNPGVVLIFELFLKHRTKISKK